MQTTKSNSYSPDYRRRYQTTANSCECPANMNGKAVCKHIRLERFKAQLNRRVNMAIISAKQRGDNRSALQIRLDILINERNNQLYYLAEEKRKEFQHNVDWLRSQIKQLERRVVMLQRNPRPKRCDHKRTRETGMRQKEVHCLDCKSHIRTYYPMST